VENKVGEVRVFGEIGDGIECFLDFYKIWEFEDRVWLWDGFWRFCFS